MHLVFSRRFLVGNPEQVCQGLRFRAQFAVNTQNHTVHNVCAESIEQLDHCCVLLAKSNFRAVF